MLVWRLSDLLWCLHWISPTTMSTIAIVFMTRMHINYIRHIKCQQKYRSITLNALNKIKYNWSSNTILSNITAYHVVNISKGQNSGAVPTAPMVWRVPVGQWGHLIYRWLKFTVGSDWIPPLWDGSIASDLGITSQIIMEAPNYWIIVEGGATSYMHQSQGAFHTCTCSLIQTQIPKNYGGKSFKIQKTLKTRI